MCRTDERREGRVAIGLGGDPDQMSPRHIARAAAGKLRYRRLGHLRTPPQDFQMGGLATGPRRIGEFLIQLFGAGGGDIVS